MTKTKKACMGKIFKEFGKGKLESSSGKKVKSKKQAVAIAISVGKSYKKHKKGKK